jgi:hypothetical protein
MKTPLRKTKSLTWREKQAQSLPSRASSPPGGFRLRVLLDAKNPRQLLNTSHPDGEYRIDAMAEEMLSAGLLPEVLAELEQAAAVDLNDPD